MSTKSQSLAHHARFDPVFHGFLAAVIGTNLVIAIVSLVREPSFHHVWGVVISIAFIPLWLRIRQYPLKVQDRVIRLEERLRLQALAPPEWHSQIYLLTEDQLIALRFAADDEVVELARQALEFNLTRKQIKERIRSWRPDNWRV